LNFFLIPKYLQSYLPKLSRNLLTLSTIPKVSNDCWFYIFENNICKPLFPFFLIYFTKKDKSFAHIKYHTLKILRRHLYPPKKLQIEDHALKIFIISNTRKDKFHSHIGKKLLVIFLNISYSKKSKIWCIYLYIDCEWAVDSHLLQNIYRFWF